MDKWLACAASPGSGVRHRISMLSLAKHFAEAREYSVCMAWGVSSGVSFRRFEELFAPIPGVKVINLTAEQLNELARHAHSKKHVQIGNRTFQVFRDSKISGGDLFCWDLRSAKDLSRMISGQTTHIVAKPSATIRAQSNAYVRLHAIENRLGIRVRVEENPHRDRKPHRTWKELNQVVKSIIRIPWYTRVFIATDSEYIQQMLSSHFSDSCFLPKCFDLVVRTGRYVHRQDKDAMFTFLKEVDCLCRCRRIINIGNFLNDHSVRKKWLAEPYREAARMHLVRQ